MFDPQDFTFTQMLQTGASLRKIGEGAESMAVVADRIVQYFYDNLIIKNTNQKACVLVRLFKTHSFDELDEGRRQFATTMLHGAVALPATKCLTLLATKGEKPEWNSTMTSKGHRAIPLVSEEIVQSFPMISQLLLQLGTSLGTLQKRDPALMLEIEQSAFNVFYVPEAQGSPYVPAQKEFVIPYGIKSVLGFGGLLPLSDLFAVILFSRVHIPRESAELFKTLALSVKLEMVPFAEEKIFT